MFDDPFRPGTANRIKNNKKYKQTQIRCCNARTIEKSNDAKCVEFIPDACSVDKPAKQSKTTQHKHDRTRPGFGLRTQCAKIIPEDSWARATKKTKQPTPNYRTQSIRRQKRNSNHRCAEIIPDVSVGQTTTEINNQPQQHCTTLAKTQTTSTPRCAMTILHAPQVHKKSNNQPQTDRTQNDSSSQKKCSPRCAETIPNAYQESKRQHTAKNDRRLMETKNLTHGVCQMSSMSPLGLNQTESTPITSKR